jgi:hypothetical protein
MSEHREAVLAETRRRWRERDLTPLIPGVTGEKLRIMKGKGGLLKT